MLSPENWLKQGLTIRQNEEPFKTVKASSHSIGKKREDEALKEVAGEGRMTRLYGKVQKLADSFIISYHSFYIVAN